MFTNAKNPRWADTARGKIVLDVRFINEDEYVPFVASADDCTSHGPMLFHFASNGLFGPVRDSDGERMLRGELPPPPGHVVEDGRLRPMTEVERFEAGLDERPGYKVVDGEFVAMTPRERLDAGQVTEARYKELMAEAGEAELRNRLAELQTPEATARAEIDEGYAANRRERLAALLAVREQEGWPFEVRWPDDEKPQAKQP